MEGLWRQTQNICKQLYNVGPTSSTLVQHCTAVIQLFTGNGGLLGEVFRQIDSQEPTVFRSYH